MDDALVSWFMKIRAKQRVILSMGREVVGPGHSRVKGVAAKVTDKKENSGNHGQVNWVRKKE
jgi:hypothetical protein